MAEWRRVVPDLPDRLTQAMIAGQAARARVVANEVKRRLAGGYTTGDFVTGLSLNSVQIADPVVEGNTVRTAVGTDLLYNLFWELGHNNFFTRRFERQERWVPAFLDTIEAQREAFIGAFDAVMGSEAASTSGVLGSELGMPLVAGPPRQGPNFPKGAPNRPFGRKPR